MADGVGTVAAELRRGTWTQGAPAYRAPLTVGITAGVIEPGGYGAYPQIPAPLTRAVEPLRAWVSLLDADEETVEAFAVGWQRTAAQIEEIARDIRNARQRLDDMDGRTVRAMRKRFGELETEARVTAEWVGAAATALDEASRIVVSVRRMVLGALEHIASRAVTAATSGPALTPGSLIDPALEAEAGQCVAACQGRIEQMRADFDVLIGLLHGIGPRARQSLDNLNEIIRELGSTDTVTTTGVDHWFDRLGRYSPLIDETDAARDLFDGLRGLYPDVLVDSLLGMHNDLTAADPEVWELHPDELDAKRRRQLLDSMMVGAGITKLSQLVKVHGQVDAIGGSEQTVIDIKKVVDPATGQHHYVIALPSTQDWNHLAPFFPPHHPVPDPYVDAGATNDFDSNLGFVLGNKFGYGAETQYQRAVREAMEMAGIDSDDNVLYTGFSQGGIAAAAFAADPTMPGKPIGIVVNGAATNGFDIPEDVRVLEYRHEGDPIGWVDTLTGGDAEHEHVIEAPAPEGARGFETHNQDRYLITAEAFDEELGPEYAHLFGDVVDQQQYTWTEHQQ